MQLMFTPMIESIITITYDYEFTKLIFVELAGVLRCFHSIYNIIEYQTIDLKKV